MYTMLFFACSGASNIKDSASNTDSIGDTSSESMDVVVEPSSEEIEAIDEPSHENNETDFSVVLNEIVAKSDVTDDWIEIYNEGNQDIDISGFGLIDDIDTDIPWLFPEGTILVSGGFVLVWADDGQGEDTQADINSSLHATFKLSKDGETVYLMDVEQRIVSEVTFPELIAEQSYARQFDGSWLISDNLTPMSAN